MQPTGGSGLQTSLLTPVYGSLIHCKKVEINEIEAEEDELLVQLQSVKIEHVLQVPNA